MRLKIGSHDKRYNSKIELNSSLFAKKNLSWSRDNISPSTEYDSQILGGKCELETLINACGIPLEIKSLFL
jgi:hypothetical protein